MNTVQEKDNSQWLDEAGMLLIIPLMPPFNGFCKPDKSDVKEFIAMLKKKGLIEEGPPGWWRPVPEAKR